MGKLRAKGDRTKAIPPRYAEPFRERLAKWVQDWTEERNETQTAAAAFLGMSQPHLSALISGRRSLGLAVLLELYEQTGITPNEWLGLSKQAAGERAEPNEQFVSAVVSGVAELLSRQKGKTDDPPHDPPRLPPAEHHRVRGRLQGK